MKHIGLLLLGVFFFNGAFADDTIRYHVSFPNAVHHEANIELKLAWRSERPLLLNMAQSSPGRYAIHNFAKNIYKLQAEDTTGKKLNIQRTDINQWKINNAKGDVKISYTLWGNTADGTYAGINANQAMLNIPASFIYVPGLKVNPIKVHYQLPKGWQVATQMPKIGDSYYAPNLNYFMDSPTLIGKLDIIEWQIDQDGNPINFRFAIHHLNDSAYINSYIEWTKAIVKEQQKVYGEFPAFDFGTYTFIANYAPYARGDGMEHRNSTILSSNGSIFANGRKLIGTLSHEFFHAWNVERLRPASLQPFLYDKANMSSALWFGEGFTSYYTDLILCRSGIIDRESYLSELSYMINTVLTSAGPLFHSPIEMSQMAPFVDAAVHSDATSFYNTYTSYYTYGAAIALALDLQLRNQFEVSLDDYMQRLWINFGKSEIPYTISDLQNTLAMISDRKFADDFFKNHIFSSSIPDYKMLLAPMGIDVKPAFGPQLFLSERRLTIANDGIYIQHYPEAHSPLYKAGIDKGDLITRINNEEIINHQQIEEMLIPLSVGDSIPITYQQFGQIKEGFIKPKTRRNITLTFFSEAENQEKLNKWLSDN